MCMDEHLTQTTERTQQQHLQDKTTLLSCPTHNIFPDFTSRHTEFPPGMENTPVFPGNQFLQGKEKIMDTGTFTLGKIILNRYSALSILTHQATEPGRVPQNFQQLKMESSDMEALPCFNSNAEATPQMETSRKGPGADWIQNGKDTTVTSSPVTPMDPVDNIQPPTRKCILTINVHSQDSHSSKSDQLKKSKVQGNWLTRLSHYINTGFPCDQKSLPRDLHKYWNDRETLSINLKMDTNMSTNRMITIQQLMSEHCYGSISNRSAWPEENTAQEKYLSRLPGYNSTDQLCDRESWPTDLSESLPHKKLLYNRPELINKEQIIPVTHKEPHILSRPSKAMAHQYQHTEKEVHLLSGPSELQPVNDCVTQHTPQGKDQDLLQLPDASEAQKLKGPTQIQWQTRHNYSRLTENEKAKFQTPFTYNDERNFVERNPVKEISDDLVYPTKDTSSAYILSELEEREEITEDVPAPAPANTLETVEGQPYTPGSRKSMKKNFGRPASAYSDSYMQTLSQPGLVDDQYKVELLNVFAKFFCLFLLWLCIKYIVRLWATLWECTLGSYRVLHFYQHKYI